MTKSVRPNIEVPDAIKQLANKLKGKHVSEILFNKYRVLKKYNDNNVTDISNNKIVNEIKNSKKSANIGDSENKNQEK